MRHRVYGRYLGRNKDQREALFKNLVQALFLHGTIKTSESKAKAIKGLVDKVINLAKNKNTKRLLQSYLNKELSERLTKEIVPKLGTRSSGYTSMVRLGTRLGDRTMMVKMSLIGAEKLEPIKKVTSDKKQVTSKKTVGPIKKEVKVKEKNEKVVRKPTRTVKLSASRKGAKRS